MSITKSQRTREAVLRRISRLARQALFGSRSETYRSGGRPGCRCPQGHKHGPHLYVSFRGPEGTTSGYYVPQDLAEPMRQGGGSLAGTAGGPAPTGGIKPAAPVGAEESSPFPEES